MVDIHLVENGLSGALAGGGDSAHVRVQYPPFLAREGEEDVSLARHAGARPEAPYATGRAFRSRPLHASAALQGAL
jgi:hypothetical protein